MGMLMMISRIWVIANVLFGVLPYSYVKYCERTHKSFSQYEREADSYCLCVIIDIGIAFMLMAWLAVSMFSNLT